MIRIHEGNGRQAFLLLQQTCQQLPDDLQLLQMENDWNGATILGIVGYKLESISQFARYLNQLNARRPIGRRKTEDELTVKLLSCMTSSIESALGHAADVELRAAPNERKFWVPPVAAVVAAPGVPAVAGAPGRRDFAAAVTWFDDLWNSKIKDHVITTRNPRAATGESARVAAATDVDEDGVYAVGTPRPPPISRDSMAREAICWVCSGFGHMAKDCPSPVVYAVSLPQLHTSNPLPKHRIQIHYSAPGVWPGCHLVSQQSKPTAWRLVRQTLCCLSCLLLPMSHRLDVTLRSRYSPW